MSNRTIVELTPQNGLISVSRNGDMIASALQRLDRIERIWQQEYTLISLLRRRLEGILNDRDLRHLRELLVRVGFSDDMTMDHLMNLT